MSLKIVQQVDREYPEYLQRNVGETCHWFTVKVLERLRAEGHSVFHVCKSPGERQYIPNGFKARGVTGLDGKTYFCSGVSHDALWVDDKQYDVIVSANNEPDPISDSRGRIVGKPAFNPVPEHEWRPNNPPLKMDPVVINPPPQFPPYPFPEDAVDGAGVALFADFAQAGQAPNPQMFRFAFRIAYSWLTKEHPNLDTSVREHRKGWRAILGLPQ